MSDGLRAPVAASGRPAGDVTRAVLLDALGTLVELEPPVEPLRRELRDRCGIEVSAVQAAAALRAEIAFYRAHHDEAPDRTRLADLRRRAAEALREALPPAAAKVPPGELTAALLAALRFRAFPEVPEVLRAARERGLRLVVVSNWDVSLHDVLAATGLAPLLDGVVTSAELGSPKPQTAIFARGLELAGATAREAVHVGDSVAHDVAGARAAGIEPLLLVRDGAEPDAPAPAGVRTIASLRPLLRILSA
ncbi:MAG: HAD family hydrolase [Actinobacteria bacterium]|nr:HAD family hydrolase [Actinomycetota bacterium]